MMASRGHGAAFPATPTSMQSPLYTIEAPIYTWTDSHVTRWLTNIKCGNHADTFRDNDIRGDVLLELDQITLKEMGITSIGDRLRIISAVKSLRQKATRPPVLIHSDYDSRVPEAGPSKQSPTSRLGARKIPAPLQLASVSSGRNDLPRIVRDGSAPDSARINHAVRPLPQPNQSYGSNGSSTPAPASARLNALPPLPPAPRSQPPPPPGTRTPNRNLTPGSAHISGRRTPTQGQGDVSQYTNQPLPLAPGLNTPTYPGLPSDPRPSVVRSQSPLPPPPRGSSRYAGNPPAVTTPTVHGRGTSLSVSAGGASPAMAPKVPVRSNTANPQHPYATASPAAPLQLGNPANAAQLNYNLSPIAESFLGGSSSTPSPPTGSYAVGRGPFNRPNTPSNNNNPIVAHKIVKFVLSDDGSSRKIDVADCVGGVEILEKALRKFDLSSGRHTDNSMDHVQTSDGSLVVDGWAVYVEWQGDVAAVALSETELMAVCHAPSAARDRGMTLKRIGKIKRSKALQQIFGEAPPIRYENGISLSVEDAGDGLLTPGYGKGTAEGSVGRAAKRASAVSILSGLGVRDPERALEPPSSPGRPPSPFSSVGGSSQLSPTSLKSPGKKPSKLRNFFGQRPPSELITNHLQEYFPSVEKKVLERTARHSMMRTSGVGRRESIAGPGGRRGSVAINKRNSTASWNPQSRFSSSTMGSSGDRESLSSNGRPSMDSLAPGGRNRSSTYTQHDVDLPRVSLSTEDGRSVDLNGEDGSGKIPELPPVTFTSESLTESMENLTGTGQDQAERANRRLSTMSTASKRYSYMTELRSKRDRSDTASLMTVDEITASVESRRESMAVDRPMPGFGGGIENDWTDVDVPVTTASEEDDEDPTATLEQDAPEQAVDIDDEEEFSQGEEEDEEKSESDSDDDEPNKAVTSKGGSKWIKGALIGAGSFGQVYLGMDASSGLLMAVKQVEMPTGTTPAQDRKQSMLTALELEIELLKELQHENIVQYLYSSLDDGFLNIFLEYVPGGSVTALLRSYGAFEETLVKNFVRQISQGLDYLHSKEIIHRDIKGGNILVDNKGGIKISDFGISKKVDGIAGNRNRPSLQGSVFWMAPEVVKQKAHTRKADIWSVGCLIVEMLTGDHPWAQLTQMQAIFKIGSSAKPTVPSDISVEAQDFLERTFDLDYEARPDAIELLQHPWLALKKSKSKEAKAAAAAAALPTADP